MWTPSRLENHPLKGENNHVQEQDIELQLNPYPPIFIANIFTTTKFFIPQMNAFKMNQMYPLEAEECKNVKIVRCTYLVRYITSLSKSANLGVKLVITCVFGKKEALSIEGTKKISLDNTSS